MTAAGRDPFLLRLERDSLIMAGLMALAAVALWPDRPGRALGVLGGIALIGLSYRAITAGVEGLWPAASVAESSGSSAAGEAPGRLPNPAPTRRPGFVKFFTRHAILGVGAYVMMARFEFDPMAMLAGVTAPAVAASVEFVRTVRARHDGPHSRSS